MPFDGLFLNKLSKELNFLVDGKISKVLEVSDFEYILQIRANYKKYNLFLSMSNENSRINLTNQSYDFPQTPKSFTMLLRKYLEGNIINNIYTYKNDRILVMDVKGLTEIGDLESKKIIIELLGRQSNLILTKNDIIIDALKKDSSIDSKRIIFPNATYYWPESNKINPFDLTNDKIKEYFSSFLTSKDLSNKFNGISLPVASYIMNQKDPYNEFINLINKDIQPIIYKFKSKNDFYYTSIGYETIKEYNSLSEMLDDYFFDLSLKERIKQKTNDLALTIDNKISKLENKIINLNNDLKESNKAEIYKLYGELLIANSYIKEKSDSINVINYYNNESINIPLDIRYNIIDNSKLYFKKYQKAKNAKKYIEEQINITNEEIDYLKIIKSQVEHASLSDMLEIKDELSKNRIISSTSTNTKVKKAKTKILSFILNDGKIVYVGKNNLQNEIVTHKLAKSNSLWFHIKDAPGSHVILEDSNDLTEYDIRMCAYIASYYSSFKDSSSVPVDYTYAKYIKKIPGKRNCFVTYTNQKTIYIDPEKEIIDSLQQKNIEF